MRINYIALFLSLLIATTSRLAGEHNSACNDLGPSYYYNGALQRGGLYKSSVWSVRARVVFAQFQDDNTNSTSWPLNQRRRLSDSSLQRIPSLHHSGYQGSRNGA